MSRKRAKCHSLSFLDGTKGYGASFLEYETTSFFFSLANSLFVFFSFSFSLFFLFFFLFICLSFLICPFSSAFLFFVPGSSPLLPSHHHHLSAAQATTTLSSPLTKAFASPPTPCTQLPQKSHYHGPWHLQHLWWGRKVVEITCSTSCVEIYP